MTGPRLVGVDTNSNGAREAPDIDGLGCIKDASEGIVADSPEAFAITVFLSYQAPLTVGRHREC